MARGVGLSCGRGVIGLIPRGGVIIWFVGVGLARGPATLADTRDPPCADEYDPGKVWQVWLAGTVGWVRLAGRPPLPMGETHPYQTGPAFD